ncbi:MAG: nucleoside monophosphate kinase [Bacilli bacterium]|nr:nucleoside monophosphate kinase [Bacilli bacterium]
MISIILLAPPAGGKGTISGIISNNLNIPHISTGDLLRREMEEESEIGINIKEKMESGKLISDNIIYSLLEKRLSNKDCNNGYILDGFPRNINQALEYEKIINKLGVKNIVILLDTKKEVCIKRVTGRLSCKNCGRVYNIYTNLKPINDNTCDTCNIPLTKRSDDNIETYEIRYNEYISKTTPLINYYKEKGILYTFDGNNDEISNDILEFLKEF